MKPRESIQTAKEKFRKALLNTAVLKIEQLSNILWQESDVKVAKISIQFDGYQKCSSMDIFYHKKGQ